MRLLAALLLFSPLHVLAQELGVVTSTQGTVETARGTLEFVELTPGASSVRTNEFGQYKGAAQEKKARVKWDAEPKRAALTVGAHIPKEIIETGAQSWTRLYFKDDTIVDLGPETLFQVQKFDMDVKERHITLRLLKGRARILVVRKLEGQSSFEVTTPGALVSVRGTDFVVHTDLSGDEAHTTVIGVRGQVTTDLVRLAKKGEIYRQPVVVNTYSRLSVRSVEGYALSYDLDDKLSPQDYAQAIEDHAPLTDPKISVLGTHPAPGLLPGTAHARLYQKTPPPPGPPQNLAEELQREHAVADLGGLTLSGNFQPPTGLTRDTDAVNNRLGPYLRELGPSRVDRLPYERLRLAAPGMVPVRQ